MMKYLLGKIIVVDDDVREKRLVEIALKVANWDITVDFYRSAKDALKSLHRVAKEHLLDDNFIPFIFASSSSTEEQIAEAFKHNIQGFFSKPISIDEQANILNAILSYWSMSVYRKQE